MNFPATYRALVAREAADGSYARAIETLPFSNLPHHEVTIRVATAALNYKDALSANGHKGITKKYPHTPGVDAAGTVVHDESGTFTPGSPVICTSYDLGMNTAGGFAEFIRVPAQWVLPLPIGLSFDSSMVLGTAAYTAGLALYKLEMCGQNPSMGPIAVTGATGGVGSMAIALLAHAGYETIAVTGSINSHDYLRALGATSIIDRAAANDPSSRVLLRSQWAGAIDNVGGNTLATLLKACGRNGSVASVGLVDSAQLNTTVYPFILNGVNLLGVDSAETPRALREEIWRRLASTWRFELPHGAATFTHLDGILTHIDAMLLGKTQGRIVARIQPAQST